MLRKGLCFTCYGKNHTSKDCPKRQTATGEKPVNSNACVVDSAQAVVHSTQARQSIILQVNVGLVHSETLASQIVVNKTSDDYNKSVGSDDECVDTHQSFINADEFHVRSYIDIIIESLPDQKALIDGGSEICCIEAR
jgi:hypothetical protein